MPTLLTELLTAQQHAPAQHVQAHVQLLGLPAAVQPTYGSMPSSPRAVLLHSQQKDIVILPYKASSASAVLQVFELLQLLGMNTRLEDVQLMVDEIDIDKSGAVDFDEFLQVRL